MNLDVAGLLTPPTETAANALAVVQQFSDIDMVGHCRRSWAWSVLLAESEGFDPDRELLFVAAMLHDLGVAAHFDAHTVPFEVAGGSVAAVFAAGAGWDLHRQRRVADIIERHMQPTVDPEVDVEGYLLEAATSLDVSGHGFERWDASELRQVMAAAPRGDFSSEFDEAIARQAVRKPISAAARLDASRAVSLGGGRWETFSAG